MANQSEEERANHDPAEVDDEAYSVEAPIDPIPFIALVNRLILQDKSSRQKRRQQ
jgi:hypothetical protein